MTKHPHWSEKKQNDDADTEFFRHEGDCLGSACPVCGCCMHCDDDCSCTGCVDDPCLCSTKNGAA